MSPEQRRVQFWPVILAIFFGSFLSSLSTFMMNIAMPALMVEFDVPLATIQWGLTGFMLAFGAVSPLAGYLGDRFTTKRVYLLSLAGFLGSSVLCAVAWDAPSLIAFRVLQGLACGLIMPTTMTIIYQVMPPARMAMAISLHTASGMLAPALGPTLAGWLIARFAWQAVFLINLPLGLIGILLAAWGIPHYRLSAGRSLDVPGLLSSVAGSVALLMAFSLGPRWGWFSGRTLGLAAAGGLVLALFVWWELRTPHPMLNLRVFQNGTYARSVAVTSIITVTLFSGILLTPLFLQQGQNRSPLEAGLILMLPALAMAATTPVTGKLYNLLDPRLLFIPGLGLITLGCWMMGHLTSSTTPAYVMGWMTVRMVGFGLSTTPITNTGMMSVRREWSGHASAINNWLRQGIGSLSIGVFSALLTSRVASHAAALAGDSALPPSEIPGVAMARGVNELYIATAIIALLAMLVSLRLTRGEAEAVQPATGTAR